MERQLAVSQLIANDASPWGEADRTFLMGVDDGQFVKLAANPQTTGEPASPPTNPPNEAPCAPATPAVQAAETPATAADPATPQPVTVQSYIDAAPEPFREWLGEGLATLQKERDRLVKILTDNQRCPISEAQLKEKRTDELRQLVQLAGTAPPANNYAGQAPVSANAADVPAAYKPVPKVPEWPTTSK